MKTYDILLFKNHVYIGMEDVSTTYREAAKKIGLSAKEAQSALTEAFTNWNNDEVVIRARENAAAGKRSYYPNEYKTPCLAIIAETGILDDCHICNYNDICKIRNKGAKDIFFSEGLKDIDEYFN